MRMYCAPDDSELLKAVKSDWPELWPKISRALKEMSDLYERSDMLKLPKWIAWAAKLTPDVWMHDKADFWLGIQINGEWPMWDFFMKGTDIVHHQPVF